MSVTGTYPFGSKLTLLVQQDRTPKKIFVLGVYASAVHATWVGPDSRVLIRALAVASEPAIFWDGSGAGRIIAGISVPAIAGRLKPADAKFNGPSGRCLDADFLVPLGLTRSDTWLADLVPHTCLNASQLGAIKREYEPRREKWKLPQVDLPNVPKSFADGERRTELAAELDESKAEILVLLGDKPIQAFLTHYDPKWKKLSDFGPKYGQLHPVSIRGRRYRVLPLAHPRQVGALGMHSPIWRERHEVWKRDVAPTLLRS